MMLFPARSEAIHCSRNRIPKIRLADNPITFQVFISIIKKENVPNTDIFLYRIELPPSQEGGVSVELCSNLPICSVAATVRIHPLFVIGLDIHPQLRVGRHRKLH